MYTLPRDFGGDFGEYIDCDDVEYLLDEITRLEGENERYAEALDRIIQGTIAGDIRQIAIEARHPNRFK